MKKIVPDPPSQLSHTETLQHAKAHLDTALAAANELPGLPQRKRDASVDSLVRHVKFARSLVYATLLRMPDNPSGGKR